MKLRIREDRISAENLAHKEEHLEGQQKGIGEVKFLNAGMSTEKVSQIADFSREEIYKFQDKSKQ